LAPGVDVLDWLFKGSLTATREGLKEGITPKITPVTIETRNV
jgi:hypothetical protein